MGGLFKAKITGLEEELEAERANRSKVCILQDRSWDFFKLN